MKTVKKRKGLVAGLTMIVMLMAPVPMAHAGIVWTTFATALQDRLEEVLQQIKVEKKDVSQANHAKSPKRPDQRSAPHPEHNR